MIDLQIALLESLEEQQAFCPANAVLFGKIKDNAKLPVTMAELTGCRNAKLIDYVKKNNLTYYFLSKKGIEFLDDSRPNPTAKCTEEPQCPASVGGNIDPDTDDSILNDEAASVLPEYEQANDSKQHTDAFINAMNEDIKPIEIVEFIVVDKHGDIAHDSFETISDAIHKAHDLAASTASEYHVERMSTQRMGSVKLITATQWVAAA
jgi:hypothetical protein